MSNPKIGIIMGSKSDLPVMQDAADICKAFGVDFEIRVYGGYNKREVLTKCITELQNYFNIEPRFYIKITVDSVS